ncbi:MAG TPA: AsmA family protein, partial [Blastocatellia bacterium]|nr:AsmA family protein [Blastocatellia bacterium]
MRRRLLIGALVFLGLILLLAVAVLFYIRSGRLDRFLQAEIVKSLAEVGIRAEIGNAHLDLSRPYKVILQDVRLYPRDSTRPLATLDRIEARFSVLDYLRQNIKITDVEVIRPRVWVEIDKRGNTNLDALHSPPETPKKRGGNVALLSAIYRVENGELTVVDNLRELTAEIKGLSATFTPNDPNSIEDILNNTLNMDFKGGVATYQGRPVQHVDGQVKAILKESGADIPTLKISSDLGDVSGQGRVESYRPLKYDFSVRSALLLDRVSYVVKPGMRLGGKAAIRGEVSGTGPDYRVTGEISSSGLAIENFAIQGLKVATDLRGQDGRLKGTAQVTSSGATGDGTRSGPIKLATNVVAGPGRFGVTGGLSIASVERGQITINGISGKIDANRDRGTITDLSANL